jgi:CubicO group peptidase (beta-lactamase class C family)
MSPLFRAVHTTTLLVALPTLAAAQLPRARAEAVGMSSARLARIPAAMRRFVERSVTAGVVTLVARDGRAVELDTAGYRDAASRSPMRLNTIFRRYASTLFVTEEGVR